MAGLVPAIHVFLGDQESKTWMPGIKPGMTSSEQPPRYAALDSYSAKPLLDPIPLVYPAPNKRPERERLAWGR